MFESDPQFWIVTLLAVVSLLLLVRKRNRASGGDCGPCSK